MDPIYGQGMIGQQIANSLPDWSVQDVLDFLETCRNKFGNKVDTYRQLVLENDVDGEVLAELTDDQLTELGINSFGHRHYILKRLQAIRSGVPSLGVASFSSSGSTTCSSGYSANGTAPAGMGQPPMGYSRLMLPPSRPLTNQFQPNLIVNEDHSAVHSSRPAAPRLQQPTPRIHESKVSIGRKIGSGSVGHVYAGTYESHPVAIKKHKMDGSMMDSKALIEFEFEVGKMTAVNHPCIVRCYGMLEPTPGIVLELVEGSSLFQIVHGERGESFTMYQQRLPWPVRLRYLLDSAYGLRAVHNAGLIHGDFKTLNLLVGADQRVKVADFGLSKVLDVLSVLPGTKTITGTPQYMAPEVVKSQPQGMRVDVYSLAIVMWELLNGLIPWKGMDIVQIIQKVTDKANDIKGQAPPGRPPIDPVLYQTAPPGYIQLMQICWAQCPNDRPSTDQCVQTLEGIQRNQRSYPAPSGYGYAAQSPAARMNNPIPSFMKGPAVAPGKFGVNDLRVGEQLGMPILDGGIVHGPVGQYDAMLAAPIGVPRPLVPQWQPTVNVGEGLNPPPIFLAAGGMSVLVEMLKARNEKTQVQAAGALSLACAANPENQATLFKTGGITQMVALLNQTDRPELQSKIAAAIAAACAQNKDNRREVLRADGVAPLVELLRSRNPVMQENAANALANVVKRKKDGVDEYGEREEDGSDVSTDGPRGIESDLGAAGDPLFMRRWAGQAELNKQGGVAALVGLMQTGAPRVKEAAAAAIANAIADHSDNRNAFQEAGGVEPMLGLLRTGDPHAQENATTALWNAMVDNESSRLDILKHHGMPLLVQQLVAGTPIGQELAAGAIWKACSNDQSVKSAVRQAIPGLVSLLRSGSASAKEQAAGALRSACVNSAPNKAELNRVNGIVALVETMRAGTARAREQAGAALANACANSSENQVAARHANAIGVLVECLREDGGSPELLECAVAAIRNICVGCRDNQEELNRCGGIQPLLMLLQRETRPQLLEYTVGALWKACSLCDANKAAVRAHGIRTIEALGVDEGLGAEARRCCAALLRVMSDADVSSIPPIDGLRPEDPLQLDRANSKRPNSAMAEVEEWDGLGGGA